MAYFYNPDVYNTTTDVKDLQQRIEDNFEALVHNFSGGTYPGSSFPGMFFYNTTEQMLKIYTDSGSWLDIFSTSGGGGAASILDGSVTAAKISNSARKPSLVDGASITPGSCTLRSKPMMISMPTMAESDPPVKKVIWANSWEDILKARVYVPSDIDRIYLIFRGRRESPTPSLAVRFSIGGQTSGVETSTSTSFVWYPELEVNVSSLTGWQDVVISIMAGGTTSQTVYYQGYSFRSAE